MSIAAGTDQHVLNRLIELFDLARQRDYTRAAAYVAYKGPDKARELKTPFQYGNADEHRSLEAIVNRIGGWLEESDDHEFGEYIEQNTDGTQWHAWEVRFQKGPDQKRRYFGFLNVDGVWLLGDIDR